MENNKRFIRKRNYLMNSSASEERLNVMDLKPSSKKRLTNIFGVTN